MSIKVYQMDVFEGLKQLKDESVDSIVTSPPYWAVRNYFEGVVFKKNLSEKQIKEIIEELDKRGIKPKNLSV